MARLLGTILRHARIARQLARIGIIRKSQFRVEFASQVIMDCTWYAAKIAVFEILFLYTNRLATWSIDEVRVFLGFVFVSDAFMMMWLGARWKFGRDLKDGKLDPIRVRPAPAIFLYFFQQFSPEAALNMVVAAGYLIFGLARVGALSSFVTWPVLVWAVLLSWWTMIATTVFFSTVEFYLLSSDLSAFVTHAFDPVATNPLDVFTRRVQLFFLYLIPVGVMTHVPACMVLKRFGLVEGLVHSAWIVAFGMLAFGLWNRSFHRYESAMS